MKHAVWCLLLMAGSLAAQINPTGQHGVTLTWNASTGQVTGYNAYRAAATGGCSTITAPTCTKLTTTPVAVLTYTDGCPVPPGSCTSPQLTEGTTFFYVVTATGPGGESGPSLEVSAKIPTAPPAVPTSLTATPR